MAGPFRSVRFVTNASEEVEPILAESGPNSETPITVMETFKNTVAKNGDSTALRVERDGAWVEYSWTKYYDECIRFAKSLLHLEFPAHASVNIIGFNSPEWLMANCGAIAAGGIAAGIYTTNAPDACQYVSEHSDAEVVVVEGKKQLDKYLEIAANLPRLKALVVYGEPVPEGSKTTVPIYSWEEFQALGADVSDELVEARINAQRAGQCCTLIYTSGTTGPPKAVMISHDNITWVTKRTIDRIGGFSTDDRTVSFLPLSHIAAQLLDIHAPMFCGSTVTFARPDALRGSLGATLKAVRPTVFFGVPRVWEKIAEKMWAIGKETTGIKKVLSTWAKGKGALHSEMSQYGKSGGAPCGFGCAHAIVLSKVKAALGLDACRACFTGAAPISREVLDYFASLDLPIMELFGQSECSGPQTQNAAGVWRLGSCGKDLDGTESKVDEATGELCYRGRHIFMGYLKMGEKSEETIDDEGYLHSGDQAKYDEDGFMSITGRLKELIITAGGENIPPVLIEDQFKEKLPALSNCMVVGDKRKFLVILLSLKTDVGEDGTPLDTLAGAAKDVSKEIGSAATTVSEAASCPKWAEYLEKGRVAANDATTSRAQVVQKFALLPTDFSVPGGELTPTLKLKRPVAHAKYEDIIEGLYA